MINLDNIKLYDSHIHFKDIKEAEVFMNSNLKGILSVHKISDYNKYIHLKNDNLLFSCGVHPWYCEDISFNDMLPMMEKSDFIGEIGLDNTWTDTDVNLQEKIFLEQLEYASKSKKAVILHTKGMELEVLQAIKKFKNKYLVHWYSYDKYIEGYIDSDCYFTIGPSVLWDKTIIDIVKKVPINRLLIETDGIAAINWAYSALNKEKETEFRAALINSINKISQIKNIDVLDLAKIVEENFINFTKSIK